MSVWREVQETLYAAWQAGWADATIYAFANEKLVLPNPPVVHARVRVQSRPSSQESLGSAGNRKMVRRGAVFTILREPPLKGVGSISDLAEKAAKVFEGKRFEPHGIHFAECNVGEDGEIEGGRWWGVTAECPFWYEEVV